MCLCKLFVINHSNSGILWLWETKKPLQLFRHCSLFLQEYKACNLEACPEVRRNTPWTPWMPVNVSQDGSRQEQRFRYTCRALLPDPQQLQLGKKKVETRFCPNDGSAACQTDCECWE